jgi:hypothetical protein
VVGEWRFPNGVMGGSGDWWVERVDKEVQVVGATVV